MTSYLARSCLNFKHHRDRIRSRHVSHSEQVPLLIGSLRETLHLKMLNCQMEIIQAACRPSIWKALPPTYASSVAGNAVRQIIDGEIKSNPRKELIRLALGDPTIPSNFRPPDVVVRSLAEALLSHKNHGYTPSFGSYEARKAVAEKFTSPEAPLTEDDIVLTSGCSHALQLAIESLAEPGDNILLPKPGFPLYGILSRPLGIEDRYYHLRMDKDGSIDLNHLESLIDSRTKAVVVNNPGNPTGVVFSKNHLKDVLKLADHHRVPIIADEVYGNMVFGGARFDSIADLTPEVPILKCDGISKRLMVPGLRLGWLAIHDRYDVLSEVRKGIIQLTQRMVVPNTLVQGALPAMLEQFPRKYTEKTNRLLEENAEIIFELLNNVQGLRVLKPQGTFFALIELDTELYGNDVDFMKNLVEEESVHILPGTAFNAPGWIRMVTIHPSEVITESCLRIRTYCENVLKKSRTRSTRIAKL